MSKRKTPSPVKRRNPLHDAPQLRKGGAHGKTVKAKRRADKVALKREWRGRRRSSFGAIDNTILASIPYTPIA